MKLLVACLCVAMGLFGSVATAHEHEQGHEPERAVGTWQDYQRWLSWHPEQRVQAEAYGHYLSFYLGGNVPPMHQLLTTARSWQLCGHEPYEVPPRELWSNMIPTLQLYQLLKDRQILPATTQIRSVYRNPDLNQCAGGAVASKHLANAAIDVWVPEYGDDSLALYYLKDELCRFWRAEGERYQLGLGLYATGAIHLDTQGYRKWGAQFSSYVSPCRDELFVIEESVAEPIGLGQGVD